LKFRYYLRGAGVGIIVTTVILVIAFHNNKATMSAEEIMAEAEKLGMVMPEENSEKNESNIENDSSSEDNLLEDNNDGNESGNGSNDLAEDKEPSTDSEHTEGSEDESDSSADAEPVYLTLTVERGDTSEMVSEKLLNLGLIEDAKDFNFWLCETVKLDDNILIGTFQIPQGATYEEIVALITA